MFRADLHAHTTCSDGSLSPEELVALAKESGLSGLSITDHDTVDAYVTAIPAAQRVSLRLGSGVEFSTMFETLNVHVLGYDIRLDHPDLHAFCLRHKERRKERNQRILNKLSSLGMPIRLEEIDSGEGTVGRPHIAQKMVEKGYVKSIREAFLLHIADHKPCYDAGHAFGVEETIALIRRIGGKAFLAHPHLLEHQRKIDRLLTLHFDGIECRYARFVPEKEQRWLRIAKEKRWLISGGSDFHGASKDYIPLGCSWVDEETFHAIFQRPLV